MSLLDVDKNGDKRNSPILNADDELSVGAVKSHATEGIAYRSEETTASPRVVTRDDQIIVHDGSFNKALFGRDGSGNYVVKVAEDGVDVLTATDDQLIFNSAQNVFKIKSSGVITYTPPNSGAALYTISSGHYSTSVAHGVVGSRPGIIAFFSSSRLAGFTNVETLMPYVWNNQTVSSILMNVYPTVNATHINFNFDFTGGNSGSSEETFTIRYYILQETAT